MNEKRTKLSMTGALVILSVCLLFSANAISSAIRDLANDESPRLEEQYRYEFISANDQNLIIFDKKTGEYWRKYIETNEGPTDWEKQQSPIPTQ